MVPAPGAFLPLADWPVPGGNGGRRVNGYSGIYVSLRARRAVRKMNLRRAMLILRASWGLLHLGAWQQQAVWRSCILWIMPASALFSDVGPGKKIFDGLPGCLKKTASGPKSLFSFHAGLGVSLGRIIPYRGFQLAALDIIVGLCPWKNDTGTMGFFFTFAVAQIAIIIGVGISYPFDIVRGHIQMQAEQPVEQHIYKGTVDRWKKIVAEVGIAACVYKGFVANALCGVGGVRCWWLCDRAEDYLGLGGLSGSERSPYPNSVCFFQPGAPTVRSV